MPAAGSLAAPGSGSPLPPLWAPSERHYGSRGLREGAISRGALQSFSKGHVSGTGRGRAQGREYHRSGGLI